MATWDAAFNAAPAGTAAPSTIDDKIRETRSETQQRADQEHIWLDTASTGATIHRKGSAVAYYQDFTSAPTLRPDGLTALGAADAGRLGCDSATYEAKVWDGSAWQDVTVAETTGIYTWYFIADPPGGWFLSKTTWANADYFKYPNEAGTAECELDFSSVVTAGTKAVQVFVSLSGATSRAYWRKGDDTAIANQPGVSTEYSHSIGLPSYYESTPLYWEGQMTLELSATYTVQFAAASTSLDLYVSYPFAEMR